MTSRKAAARRGCRRKRTQRCNAEFPRHLPSFKPQAEQLRPSVYEIALTRPEVTRKCDHVVVGNGEKSLSACPGSRCADQEQRRKTVLCKGRISERTQVCNAELSAARVKGVAGFSVYEKGSTEAGCSALAPQC